MKLDITQLLDTCLEIEGLLCLMANRKDSLPENVATLLRSKSEHLYRCLSDVPVEESVTSHELFPNKFECTVDTDPTATVAIEEEREKNSVADSAMIEVEEDAGAEPEGTSDVSVESGEPQSHVTVAHKPEEHHTAQIELTVNDKFRFRRELFDNNDVDLAEALQIAGQMSSAEEVEDYFYNDLCMDSDDPVVKDFIAAVTKRF